MTKKEIHVLIDQKESRKKEIKESIKKATTVEELRSLQEEIESVDNDIANYRSIMGSMPDDSTPPAPPVAPSNEAQRSKEVKEAEARKAASPKLDPLAAISIGAGAKPQGNEARGIDAVLAMPVATPEQSAEMRSELFKTAEYRTGFFKALVHRDDFTEMEKRALTTATGSGGAAVPTTTYDMIIKRMTQTSVLFGLINKTYLPGNVVLPVANAQIAATWSDTAPATLLTGTENDDTLAQVSLGSYALSKFAAVKGQLLSMAIDALETYVVSAISDQLAIAVENIILNGTGTNQPTGILTGVTFDATNSATYDKTNGLGYDDMVKARKLLGLYRSKATWVLGPDTEEQLFKIKSTTNKPLFAQNPITGLISNPLGFPYVVDYYMPIDTLLLANLDYYYMNINQNPQITNNDGAGFLSTATVFRGTMFLDAKPALSAAFVKLTRAAT